MFPLRLPPALNAIVGFATNRPLSDPALPSAPVELKLPAQSISTVVPDPANAGTNLGAFDLSITDSASLAIINEETDPDPFGFFNLQADKSTDKPDAAPQLEPPVPFDANQAYVIIGGLSVSGKISGKSSFSPAANLGLDAEASVTAAMCMAFPKTAMSYPSLTTALGSFRSVLDAADLASLTPITGPTYQILLLSTHGALDLSLKLSASSLTSALAASLDAALNRSGPFSFSTKAGATLTAAINVTDDFRVFAHSPANGTVTFSVKKSSLRSVSLDGSLGLTIQISESELNDFVTSAFAQLTGEIDTTLQKLVTAAAGQLNPDDLAKVKAILAKLNLSAALGKEVDALKDKLQSVRDDLLKRLTQVVTAKFAYTWKRVTSQTLVAQFSMPTASIAKYHADILSLDLPALLDASAQGAITFQRLLGQKIDQVDLGFGFSFGLNGFTILKSQDSLQRKFVELTTLSQGTLLHQVSFLGKRKYESQILGQGRSNYVELDASMSTPAASPKAEDFRVGLSVTFAWQNQDLSQILPEIADHGAVIGAFDSARIDDAVTRFRNAGVAANTIGDAVVTFTANELALHSLLPSLADERYRTQLAPHAMARALPYTSEVVDRGDADLRMRLYAQIMADFLSTDTLAIDTVARICVSRLEPLVAAGKATKELLNNERSNVASTWPAQRVLTMSDQASIQEAVNSLGASCFAPLLGLPGDFRDLFPHCVSAFSSLAGDPYGCRVFASLLYLAAATTPGALALTTRSVQLSWETNGQKTTIVS